MTLRKRFGRMTVWGVYAALALVVLAPLLGRGYILTLDMVFTPHLHMPTSVSNAYLFRVLLHVMNYVLPSDVIEKIMLFAMLLLAGAGMHRLLQYLSPKPDKYQKIANYFGGTFYMINPFTYDRFMAGQYDVLLGYALLPWFVYSLIKFLDHPGWRQTITLAGWAVVISIVSIHAIGFMVILAAVAAGLKIWQRRDDKAWLGNVLKFGLIGLTIFLAASSYWLVPLALGKGSTAGTISSFSAADQSAFATVGGSWVGRLGNVLRLQGFWLESRDMYMLPQDNVPVWGLLASMVWLLVIVGLVSFWRARQRFVTVLFGSSTLIAAILAVGTFNGWLAAHVPLFSGYREPEKFVALMALGFAVFAARGAAATLNYCREQGGAFFLSLATILLLFLPIVWTPTMLWGFNSQLAPVQYPADWFALNRQLDADHSNFQTLFLPWHLYMYFDFAGRIIASPAPSFFDKPMVVSDNPEYRGTAPSNSTPAKQQLDRILPQAGKHNTLGRQLALLNIKYVVLAKDNDYQNYSYLGNQADLKLIAKSATLEVYRNEAWGIK